MKILTVLTRHKVFLSEVENMHRCRHHEQTFAQMSAKRHGRNVNLCTKKKTQNKTEKKRKNLQIGVSNMENVIFAFFLFFSTFNLK